MVTAKSPAATVEADHAIPCTSADPVLFRLSLDAYRQMGATGIITRADRVVLLDGLLVQKMTRDPIHSSGTLRAARLLGKYLPAGYLVRPELPIDLANSRGGDSAPEPGISLVRGDIADYDDRHPVAADTLLVIEVADTSLRLDRIGLGRYAWASIPTAWIVNIQAGLVEILTEPA